jgi:Signal transduction histidine kinase
MTWVLYGLLLAVVVIFFVENHTRISDEFNTVKNTEDKFSLKRKMTQQLYKNQSAPPYTTEHIKANLIAWKQLLQDATPDAEIKTNLVKNQSIAISLQHYRSLNRMAIEALSNALLHSKAAFITSILALEEEGLRLIIHDTGVGFDLQEEQHSQGVQAIYEQAKIIGAELQYTSTTAGTVVNLLLPMD